MNVPVIAPVCASSVPNPVSEGGRGLLFGSDGADGEELSAMLPMLLTIPVKLGMLASELRMLPKLSAGAGVVEGAGFNAAALVLTTGGDELDEAGLATRLASAKSGMWVAMLFKEGGGGGVEPPMVAAIPANDGMLVAMMSVTPAKVGKVKLRLTAL